MRNRPAGCDSSPLLILGNLALNGGDHRGAQQLFDESIDVHRRGGDAWGLAILLSIATGLRILRDEFGEAAAQAAEALELSEALEDSRGVAWSLEVFAGLLAAKGCADAAARIWGASDALLESAGGAVLPTIGWIRDRYVESTIGLLGEARFAGERAAGRAMSTAQAIAFVRRSNI